jgi:hypothetical protein
MTICPKWCARREGVKERMKGLCEYNKSTALACRKIDQWKPFEST